MEDGSLGGTGIEDGSSNGTGDVDRYGKRCCLCCRCDVWAFLGGISAWNLLGKGPVTRSTPVRDEWCRDERCSRFFPLHFFFLPELSLSRLLVNEEVDVRGDFSLGYEHGNGKKVETAMGCSKETWDHALHTQFFFI